VRTALIAMLLAACGPKGGGGGGGGTTDPKPNASSQIPTAPPLVSQGEKFSFDLALQGVQLAVYDFEVGAVGDYDGKQTVQVHSHAKAVGLVKMVANVDDFFTSWIDMQTGRPVHWFSDEYAVKGTDRERTDVSFSKRDGDTVPVDFHLNNDPPTPEPQKVTFPEVWDYNSLMIAFRSWEASPGATITGEVFRSRFLWHYQVTVKGKDKLTTALGDFPALRLDGHVYKEDKTGQKITTDDERDFSIWVSDDAGRVPLRILGHTDYGDIEMKITAYDPGSAGR